MKIKQFLTAPQKLGPLILVIVLALAGGGAIANFIMSRQVTTSMIVIGVNDMDILSEAEALLSNIAFGELTRSSSSLYPASGEYYIRNLGDYEFFVSYTITGKPTDVTFTVEVMHEGAGTWSMLADGAIFASGLGDHHADDIRWRITLDVDPMAAFDSYSPTIMWSAFDTAAG